MSAWRPQTRLQSSQAESFAMPKLMKAAVVRSFGKPLTIEEVAIPTPGPGEVLVSIVATGVCHTGCQTGHDAWRSASRRSEARAAAAVDPAMPAPSPPRRIDTYPFGPAS